MKRFKNIMVLNWSLQSNAALERAITVAKQNNAVLKVVEVVDSHNDAMIGQSNQLIASNLASMTGVEHDQHRRESLQKMHQLDLRVEYKYLKDASHQKILEMVKQYDHDLVIVGSGSPYDHMGLGSSTLMNLVRKCAVPVWVVKPNRDNCTRQTIMAAVDPAPGPGPFAEFENTLNKDIMMVANSLAEMSTREVDVLHCWLQPMEERLQSSSASTEKDIRNAQNTTRRRHRGWLKHLLEQTMAENIIYRTHLVKGKPQNVIPELARKRQIDLVVMGSVSRAGMDGLFIGNTAEKILCYSNLSILVIKPINFYDTPVLRLSPSEADCELQSV